MAQFLIDRPVDQLDYSTIDLDRLRKLPRYKIPPTYHLDNACGAGCAGDAPGYPTYFLRSVYTQYGNRGRGPSCVISDPDDRHGTHYAMPSGPRGEHDCPALRALWKPLPVNSLRVRLWMKAQYVHFKHCYADPTEPEYGRDGTLIWPVPMWKLDSKLPRPTRMEWDSDELWAEKLDAWARYRAAYVESKRPLATPENHLAVLAIRAFYPSAQPLTEWIGEPPLDGYEANNRWWEARSHPAR